MAAASTSEDTGKDPHNPTSSCLEKKGAAFRPNMGPHMRPDMPGEIYLEAWPKPWCAPFGAEVNGIDELGRCARNTGLRQSFSENTHNQRALYGKAQEGGP